jgi:hypothetical protein
MLHCDIDDYDLCPSCCAKWFDASKTSLLIYK